jgi:hypothetical protein
MGVDAGLHFLASHRQNSISKTRAAIKSEMMP